MQDFFSTRSIPFSPENFKSTLSGIPHEFNMLTEIGPTRADGSQPVERTRDFLSDSVLLRRRSMSRAPNCACPLVLVLPNRNAGSWATAHMSQALGGPNADGSYTTRSVVIKSGDWRYSDVQARRWWQGRA